MRRPVNEVMTEQDTHLAAAESGSGRHILLVHQLFVAGDQAGGTRHFELARELGGEGDRVTVVTSPVSYLSGKPKPIATDLPAGLQIRRASLLLGGSGGFVARVISFLSFMVSSFLTGLRVRDVDLVWGTTPPIFQAPTAWLLARMKGVPFVLEVRDLWPDFAVELGVLRSPVLIRMAKGLETIPVREGGSDPRELPRLRGARATGGREERRVGRERRRSDPVRARGRRGGSPCRAGMGRAIRVALRRRSRNPQ